MFRWIGFAFLMILVGRVATATEPLRGISDSLRKSIEDELAMKTLGGRQFWGDVQFFQGWRIQRNVFTGHHRLLDPEDNRHAWGTLEKCQLALAEIKVQKKLPAMKGHAVILIHGILRSSKCMTTVASAVEKAGYCPVPFDYPSTQFSIPESAEYLDRVIQSLEGIESISIVAHSMGGLVTRAYFAEHGDPRIRRVVMLGTPNHGAELADLLYQNYLLRIASGPGGRQLVTDREGLIPSLPSPKCEFAVIAGARGNPGGWNPFIPGDDDGTVTVESTRLVGATDFAIVTTLHSAMVRNREVIERTIRFLNEGRLDAKRPCQPIESVKSDAISNPTTPNPATPNTTSP